MSLHALPMGARLFWDMGELNQILPLNTNSDFTAGRRCAQQSNAQRQRCVANRQAALYQNELRRYSFAAILTLTFTVK